MAVNAAAYGGTTCAWALAQYDSYIATFYSPSRPVNVAQIGCGTNDFSNGRTEADAYADIVAFVTAAQATGFTVIVNTVPSAQRFDTVTGGHTWRTNFNTLIRNGAATYGYTVADEASDPTIGCRTCWTTNSAYYADETHFNASGAAIKASYTIAILTGLGFN